MIRKFQLGQQVSDKQDVPLIMLLKKKQKQATRQNHRHRSTFFQSKQKIQVIDPLLVELQKFKEETSIKTNLRNANNGSYRLRNYILQQQKNLKYLRIDKQHEQGSTQKPLVIQVNEKIKAKPIVIPQIYQYFANQQKQYVIFQKKAMKNSLNKAINSIHNNVIKKIQNSKLKTQKIINQEDFDDAINKKLQMSKELMEKIKWMKKASATVTLNQNQQQRKQETPKKTLFMRMKTVPVKKGNTHITVTPACSVLFSIKKLNQGKINMETELDAMVSNSDRNRSETLHEKSMFFDSENSCKDMTPSNQFRMRKVLNKKLFHRLEWSKQQVTRFIKFINQLKYQLHIILNKDTLQLLHKVRQSLIIGKIMKQQDYALIISSVNVKNCLNIVVQRLRQMMI